MGKLQVFEHNGKLVTDSRLVAEMTDKQHYNLMRDIRRYISIMEKSGVSEIQPSDFFIPSSYVDSKGEARPCYLCTRNGCNVIANEMTGTKGMLFTVAYVTRFDETADQLRTEPFAVAYQTIGETADFLRECRLIARDGNVSLAVAIGSATKYLQAKGEPFPDDFANMLTESVLEQMGDSDADSTDGGDW